MRTFGSSWLWCTCVPQLCIGIRIGTHLLSQKCVLLEVPYYSFLVWNFSACDTSSPISSKYYSVEVLSPQMFTYQQHCLPLIFFWLISICLYEWIWTVVLQQYKMSGNRLKWSFALIPPNPFIHLVFDDWLLSACQMLR